MRSYGTADIFLPLVGMSVTRCIVDFAAFGLLLTPLGHPLAKDADALLSVEVPFECEVEGVSFECDLEHEPEGLAPALGLLRRTDERIAIDEAGNLTISFTGNAVVSVARNADFESWSLNGPRGMLAIAGPGDRLSVFVAPDDGMPPT